MKEKLLSSKLSKKPIIGVVASSGLITKAAIDSEVDFLFAFNAGLYRNMGVGSLASFMPYGNANAQTKKILYEQILPQNECGIPIIAGVFPFDGPEDIQSILEEYKRAGVRGITNWPAMGFIDGNFKKRLVEEGFTQTREIDLLCLARDMGFTTFGFSLLNEEVIEFVHSGVDGLILNLGLTKNLNDSLTRTNRLQYEIKHLRDLISNIVIPEHIIKILYGGIINNVDDFYTLLHEVEVDGYAGGSSFDRIPVYDTVRSKLTCYKNVSLSFHRHENCERNTFNEIIGKSKKIQKALSTIDKIAPYDVNLHIFGPTGIGKELIALRTHNKSLRKEQVFISINCGAIPDNLIESELFGYVKGAFTGASSNRLGKFEIANHGTLFLDEVGDLNPHGQAVLLRAIENQEIFPIGALKSKVIDVRIVSATNKDLKKMVKEGSFRADLYYRLCTTKIELDPLKDRLDDIPDLVDYFLDYINSKYNKNILGITHHFMERLYCHTWPGNIRELQHVLIGSALTEDSEILYGEDFFPEENKDDLHEQYRSKVCRALLKTKGNKTEAAKSLGISRKTLYKWLGRFE